jgi:hypothetical protein
MGGGAPERTGAGRGTTVAVRRRWIAVGAALTIVFTLFAVVARHQDASAATNRTLTVVGTDFKSLDWRFLDTAIAGTGGGADHLFTFSDGPVYGYMEANLDFPPAARVTKVDIYVRNCSAQVPPKVYFGAYTPNPAGFTYIVPQTTVSGNDSNCSSTFTFTRSGNPLTTVAGSKRYVVGILMGSDGEPKPGNPLVASHVIVGARFNYTI